VKLSIKMLTALSFLLVDRRSAQRLSYQQCMRDHLSFLLALAKIGRVILTESFKYPGKKTQITLESDASPAKIKVASVSRS
jgi:hypothetical protein